MRRSNNAPRDSVAPSKLLEPNVEAPRSSLAASLERVAVRLENAPLLSLFSIYYLVLTCLIASQKLIWDDEFFSLYISRGGFSEIHSALLTGADQHPPLFYWITYAALSIFGVGHIALRLPSILGVLLMVISLYFYMRERTSKLLALSTGLIVLNCSSLYYATEARGYGLVLGFTGMAFLCWQRACRKQARTKYLFGLSLSLMAAVSSHYYALGLVGPLFLGELIRSYQRRKIDLGVLLCLATPCIPLLYFLDVIQSAQGYSEYFWATPRWFSAFGFYRGLLYKISLPFILVASFILLYLRIGGKVDSDKRGEVPPLHEIGAAFGLLLLPLIAVATAKIFDKGFHPRYTLSAELGWGLLSIFVVSFLSNRKQTIGALILLSLLSVMLLSAGMQYKKTKQQQRSLRQSIAYLNSQKPASLPIAVAEITMMHKMAFYGPKELSDRTYYVSDPASSIRYLGHDTVDKGLIDLSPWFTPLKTIPYKEFLKNNDEFLSYGYIGDWSWLSYELSDEKEMMTTLVGRDRSRLLLQSRRIGSQKAPSRFQKSSPNVRYKKMPIKYRLSSETLTASYCSTWMNESICRLGTSR